MNIVRMYNQNRKRFWTAILIIASIILLIQLLNYFTKQNNERKQDSTDTEISSNNELTNSKVISNASAVTGGNISSSKIKETQEILDEFFDHCNNKELEKAYNMLTDECKELIYPSLEAFEANYYKNIFNNKEKAYSFENWNGNTYIVTIEEDALALGKLPDENDKKIDYVTIVDEKLNISAYIGRRTIDKEVTSDDITFKINSKDIYMDYESYNITITNNTDNTICLTKTENTDDIYIQDSNDVKYGVYNHELVQSRMIIRSKHSSTLDFKFYSSYIASKEIKGMVFENVFLNYGEEDKTDSIYLVF